MSAVFMFLCRQQKNHRQLITGCVLLIFKRLQAVNFLCIVKTLLMRGENSTRVADLGKWKKKNQGEWQHEGPNTLCKCHVYHIKCLSGRNRESNPNKKNTGLLKDHRNYRSKVWEFLLRFFSMTMGPCLKNSINHRIPPYFKKPCS